MQWSWSVARKNPKLGKAGLNTTSLRIEVVGAKKSVGTALVLLCCYVSPTTPAEAAPTKAYKNCAQLRRDWPYGVATNSARARIQIVRPHVNSAIYRRNKKLDVDRDGTVCEVPTQKQPSSSSPQTPLGTTPQVQLTTTTTTTIPVRPSGVWKMRWMGITGDSPKDEKGNSLGGPGVNVVYGEQAEVIICESSGDLPAKLEVKENGNWRTVASGFKSIGDLTRCASAERPVGFSFYWLVDVMGSKRYRPSGAAYYATDIEIRMTTSSRTALFARYGGTIENAGMMDLAVTLQCGLSGKTNC